MELICSEKIEVICNHYTNENPSEGSKKPVACIERIVSVDGEEVYRDQQKPALRYKDNSILHQFENWTNEFYSESEQSKSSDNITGNRCNCCCPFCKLWFKFFGKGFKFKT